MCVKYIYKYRDWEDDYHKRLLVENEMFFTSPKRFNDPFDSTIPFRYDLGKENEYFKLYCEHITRMNPDKSSDEIINLANEYMEKGIYKDLENIERNKEYMLKKRHEQFGVFSVSETFKNILLWSHYSKSHEGFCVEFDCKKLDKYFEINYKKFGRVIARHKIKYSKSQPVLNPFKIESSELVLNSLIIKSKVWKYELEHRYICHDGSDISVNIDEDIITKIYLGCKISEKNKNEIIETINIRNIKIKIIQCIRDEYSFNLKFEEIN